MNRVPDDEADDAGRVEGAVGVVAGGGGGRGGGVAAGVQDVVVVELALLKQERWITVQGLIRVNLQMHAIRSIWHTMKFLICIIPPL